MNFDTGVGYLHDSFFFVYLNVLTAISYWKFDLLKSVATYASLCNTLSSNKLRPKTVKILAVTGLRK